MPLAAMTCFANARRDDFQFGLAIHLGCMAGEPVEAQNNMADASVPAHGQVMALPPRLRLNFEDGPGWENRDSIARCPAERGQGAAARGAHRVRLARRAGFSTSLTRRSPNWRPNSNSDADKLSVPRDVSVRSEPACEVWSGGRR